MRQNPIIYTWKDFAKLASKVTTSPPAPEKVTCISCWVMVRFADAFIMEGKYYCPICTGIEGTLLAIKHENRVIRIATWIVRALVVGTLVLGTWLIYQATT